MKKVDIANIKIRWVCLVFIMFTNTCCAVTLFSFYLLFSIMIFHGLFYSDFLLTLRYGSFTCFHVFFSSRKKGLFVLVDKKSGHNLYESVCVLTLEYEFRWKKRQNDGPRLLLLEDHFEINVIANVSKLLCVYLIVCILLGNDSLIDGLRLLLLEDRFEINIVTAKSTWLE